MQILIIGSGGREHAIGWKIKKDNPDVSLFFAPGNGGTSQIGKNFAYDNYDELLEFAKSNSIDLTIVGPEKELVDGIVDLFQENNLKIFGANKNAADLEGNKAYAKDFMKKYGVKTAEYKVFKEQPMMAKEYLKTQKFPIVIKASGLAAGKGVVICNTLVEANKAIEDIMEKKIFGIAGNEIVIEEYLDGKEMSILSIFNGKSITPFVPAKDYKKVGDNDLGLNTGGMGAIAPNPLWGTETENKINEDIILPTLNGLIEEGLIFSGVIFFGIMITENGVYLLEYNMRFGDPETQAILPIVQSNLLDLINSAINGIDFKINFKLEYSCCIVMASGGYPKNFETGFEIKGLSKVECPVFIAGAKNIDDKLYTSGGRVLNVVGVANNFKDAINIAYENVKKINFDYEYYRKDIGS